MNNRSKQYRSGQIHGWLLLLLDWRPSQHWQANYLLPSPLFNYNAGTIHSLMTESPTGPSNRPLILNHLRQHPAKKGLDPMSWIRTNRNASPTYFRQLFGLEARPSQKVRLHNILRMISKELREPKNSSQLSSYEACGTISEVTQHQNSLFLNQSILPLLVHWKSIPRKWFKLRIRRQVMVSLCCESSKKNNPTEHAVLTREFMCSNMSAHALKKCDQVQANAKYAGMANEGWHSSDIGRKTCIKAW